MDPLQRSIQLYEEAAEAQRIAAIREAWASYFGQMKYVLKKTKSDPNREDVIMVAYTRLIVDTVVSWLFGDEPKYELDADSDGRADTGKATPEEEYLDRVWRVNRKMITLQKAATNGAVTGHTFLKILPDSPLTPGVPRVVVLDPVTVNVQWDDEDIDLVNRYKLQWNAREPSGEIVVRRQLIDRDGSQWMITDQKGRSNTTAIWETIAESVWPWEFAPIVDCQHLPIPNEYYGGSEIDDAILRLNNAINFDYSNTNRIMRIHGHPLTWGRGFSANDLSTSVDQTIVFTSTEAELKNLEMQSDLGSHFAHLDHLTEALFRIARIPLLAIGETKGVGSNLSGVALTLYFRPLLQKIDTLRLTYGELQAELNRRLLIVGGKELPAERGIVTTWPVLLPSDPLAERQALLIDQQLGVRSKEGIAAELGIDWDVEKKRLEADTDEAAERFSERAAMFGRPDDDDDSAPFGGGQ